MPMLNKSLPGHLSAGVRRVWRKAIDPKRARHQDLTLESKTYLEVLFPHSFSLHFHCGQRPTKNRHAKRRWAVAHDHVLFNRTTLGVKFARTILVFEYWFCEAIMKGSGLVIYAHNGSIQHCAQSILNLKLSVTKRQVRGNG